MKIRVWMLFVISMSSFVGALISDEILSGRQNEIVVLTLLIFALMVVVTMLAITTRDIARGIDEY